MCSTSLIQVMSQVTNDTHEPAVSGPTRPRHLRADVEAGLHKRPLGGAAAAKQDSQYGSSLTFLGAVAAFFGVGSR